MKKDIIITLSLLTFLSSLFIFKKLKFMAQEMETLKNEVAENKTVMQSAATLLRGIKQKLDEAIASNEPGALKALSDELDSNTNALAAAVSENTPAEGEAGGDDESDTEV